MKFREEEGIILAKVDVSFLVLFAEYRILIHNASIEFYASPSKIC